MSVKTSVSNRRILLPGGRFSTTPALNELVAIAQTQNNNLRIAGLRVLEARATLAIAVGNQYPQTQVAAGDVTAIQLSEGDGPLAGGDRDFTKYNLGVAASWEIDFWGRYRRAVEAADASLMASIANYDDALVLVTSLVVDTYTVIRTTEERLRISQENLALQQRSYDIVDVLFRNGASSELDVQQAETLLLSTKATIPGLEVALRQAKHALSTLLGLPPGDIENLLGSRSAIPTIPENILVGVPADMLRLRPDIRRAELNAMAQNAVVGTAQANLYPSFSLSGSLGFTNTTRTGEDGLEDLFSSDSVTYAFGPSFVWPFFNYGRIRNNIRVEDARLQQALIAYREEVLQQQRAKCRMRWSHSAAAWNSTRFCCRPSNRRSVLRTCRCCGIPKALPTTSVYSMRSNDCSVSNHALSRIWGFRCAAWRRFIGRSAGGWQVASGTFVDDATRREMEQRVDWGDLLETDRTDIQEAHDERYREE